VTLNGGAALLALHELAPSREILGRTLSLSDGRIAIDAERRPVAFQMAGASA